MGKLLRDHPNAPARLRALLAGGTPVAAPGAYDPLSARLVEAAGFPAVYMTGFGTSASLLGRPDVGLLTMTEMIDNARRIVQAVDVPVVADADTGYGNVVNVVRTVREYEQAGVAAIHLEDQVSPKRCGHMTGKQLVPASEMTEKIAAAVAARSDPDLVLIARTDARAVDGLDAAIERARSYREAGADMLFVEAPETMAEIEAIPAALPGVPLLLSCVDGGRTPAVDLETLGKLGFALVLYPVTTLFAATAGIRTALATLAATGATPPVETAPGPFDGFLDLIGLAEVREFEARLTGTGSRGTE